MALALSGCIPSADPPVPGLEVPDNYRNGGSRTEAELPNLEWWGNFRSAELSSLMRETAETNLDIAAAIARIVQADAAARVSAAALSPTLTANGSATRSQTPTSLSAGNAASGATGNILRQSYVASGTASFQLDFFGKNRAAFLAAEETSVANRWDRRTVELTSLGSTANAYFLVLSSRDRIHYAEDNLRLSTRILNLIKERSVAGTATALDQAQQEALVENVRASIPPLRLTADQNIATLAVLLGRLPERLTIRANSMYSLTVPRIATGLPSQLLLQRPDVQNAEAQLASAHASLVSARAAFFPSITLSGTGGVESLALRTLFSPASTFYTAALSVAQPIFDGGLLIGQFDQQKGRQEELLADYRKAVISAFSDVEKALVSLRELALQEEILRRSLAASRLAYNLSEDRLRQGVLDIVTLLQTQQTLFTTQDNLAQVHLSRLQAAIALYQALGGGWSSHVATGL